VAAIYTTPHAPTWLVSIKELGQIWQVDYSRHRQPADREDRHIEFLHDGFFDPTHRYFQIAANASTRWSSSTPKTASSRPLSTPRPSPHPGPGANWIDPKCGPVGGTTHLGVGVVTAWGNDPINRPDAPGRSATRSRRTAPACSSAPTRTASTSGPTRPFTRSPRSSSRSRSSRKETGEVVQTIRADRNGRLRRRPLRVQPGRE
jgi:nitrite reductase (NO-forming) / hydroxylamine reductase